MYTCNGMSNSIVQSNLIKNKINITHSMAVELFNFERDE